MPRDDSDETRDGADRHQTKGTREKLSWETPTLERKGRLEIKSLFQFTPPPPPGGSPNAPKPHDAPNPRD